MNGRIIAIGTAVAVKHGASAWQGVVTSSVPGHIIVAYPGGNQPFDDRPAREMVDLSRRRVTLVPSQERAIFDGVRHVGV